MADTARHRVRGTARSATGCEWEVFVREQVGDPLRHVGSVTAPSEERAHDRAATLFDGGADLWLCPAEEVRRFASRSLERADG